MLYQWVAECALRGNRSIVAHLTESHDVYCSQHWPCSTIFMDDKPNVKILPTHRTIDLGFWEPWLSITLLHIMHSLECLKK